MLLLVSLYDENDPEVDRTPPETTLDEMSVNNASQSATFSYSGKDDRSGGLSYSYRIDGGSWSGWSVSQDASFEEILPGTHVFEVKAKDSWLNEDSSPAEISFEIISEEDPNKEKPGLANCNCSSQPTRAHGYWAMFLGLVCLRRRRP
jgi:hypothetical protein